MEHAGASTDDPSPFRAGSECLRRSLCALALAVCLTAETGLAQQPDDVLLHCGFENSLKADAARGDPNPAANGADQRVTFEPGMIGLGVAAREPCSVQYAAPGNIREDQGAVTLWYYIEEWDPAVASKEGYTFFNIDAGNQGYTYLYRGLGMGSQAGLISLVNGKGFPRLTFPMVEAKRWHFVAVSWEKGAVDIYVDGDAAAHSDNYVFPSGWKTLNLDLDHPGRRLDEVTVYCRPLTKGEVADLFHRTGSIHNDPIAAIGRVRAPIAVDGRVTPEEWGECASLLGLHHASHGYLGVPDARVTLGYDETNLYVAFETAVPDEVLADIPNKLLKGLLKQTAVKRDEDVERDDAVGLHIIPDIARRDWYRMVVNGLNTQYDYVVSDGKVELRWDPAWKTASTVDLNGWHVEMAIPLAAFRVPAPAPGAVWGVNFLRYWRLTKDELQLWSWGTRDPETRLPRFSRFHDTDHSSGVFGKIRFAGPENVNVRVNSLGKLSAGSVAFSAQLINTFATRKKAAVSLKTPSGEIAQSAELELAPGERRTWTFQGIVNETSSLVFEVTDAESKILYYRSENPFRIAVSSEVDLSYFPGLDAMNLSVDLRAFSQTPATGLAVRVSVVEQGQPAAVLEKRFDGFASHKAECTLSAASLKPAAYAVRIETLDPAGKILSRSEKSFVKKPLPEWDGNKIGISDKVPSPFTPLQLDRAADAVSCWGRTYDLGGRLFPARIRTQGQDLLAGEIELRLTDGAGAESSSKSRPCKVTWNKVSDTRVECERRVSLGGGVEAVVESWMEYDGFLWNRLSLAGGRGAGGLRKAVLDIPLRKEWAELINPADYSTAGMGLLKPGGWNGRAEHPLWLGNAVGGLQWTCETDAPFRIEDEQNGLRVIPEADRVVLRATFADAPSAAALPLTVEFGLVATPTRPRTPDYRRLNTDNRRVRIEFGLWQLYTYIADPSRIREDEQRFQLIAVWRLVGAKGARR